MICLQPAPQLADTCIMRRGIPLAHVEQLAATVELVKCYWSRLKYAVLLQVTFTFLTCRNGRISYVPVRRYFILLHIEREFIAANLQSVVDTATGREEYIMRRRRRRRMRRKRRRRRRRRRRTRTRRTRRTRRRNLRGSVSTVVTAASQSLGVILGLSGGLAAVRSFLGRPLTPVRRTLGVVVATGPHTSPRACLSSSCNSQ